LIIGPLSVKYNNWVSILHLNQSLSNQVRILTIYVPAQI
jgi:hypothetical protein